MLFTKITIDGTAYELKAIPNEPETEWRVYDDFSIGKFCVTDITSYPILKRFKTEEGANAYVMMNKPVKKPLFTTEDGIEKFKEDTCFYVDTLREWRVGTWHLLPSPLLCEGTDLNGYKYFHSKDNAETFILINKPCLSVKDLTALWCLQPTERERLKELAKQKINP